MSYACFLREDQWERLRPLLPGSPGDPGRHGEDNRRFVEAVIWMDRNGCCWRSLPPEYGKWFSVYKRLKRWADKGIWQLIQETLATEADTEWVMIDSTVVRAHPHAASAAKA